LKNLLNKSRPIDDPYATFKREGWTWNVLRAYKSSLSETKDPYARWFVGVMSPFTHGSYELGDSYIKEILEVKPLLVYASLPFKKSYAGLIEERLPVVWPRNTGLIH